MNESDQPDRRQELDDRIREYHDVGLGDVLELVEYLRDEGDTVLAGGSLAYGLGNHGSDLDLVVAGPGGESSSRMPLEHWVKRLRVDVWRLRQAEIDDLFERADEALGSEAPFEGAFGDVLEQADLKLLHRIAHGIVLDGPSLEPSRTRNFPEIARDVIVREYGERMRESAFVAQLALDAGRNVAAVVNARFAVEEALQAAMAARGLPFSDNKWLQQRLLGQASDLAPLYAPFRALPDPGSDEAATFVASAVELCERFASIDLSTYALAPDAAWERGDLQLMAVGEERLLLSKRQGALWELDEADAAAWERLPDADSWPSGRLDRDPQLLCVELYAQGALTLRWARGLPIGELTLQEVARA